MENGARDFLLHAWCPTGASSQTLGLDPAEMLLKCIRGCPGGWNGAKVMGLASLEELSPAACFGENGMFDLPQPVRIGRLGVVVMDRQSTLSIRSVYVGDLFPALVIENLVQDILDAGISFSTNLDSPLASFHHIADRYASSRTSNVSEMDEFVVFGSANLPRRGSSFPTAVEEF